MSAFIYIALDRDGRQVKGRTEADSVKHARRVLREQGLVPVDVSENIRDSPQDIAAPQRTRFSVNDRILLTQLLAALLDSGLPIDDALGAIAKQSSSKNLETTVLALRAKVVEGHSLEQGMGFYPAAFPADYAATIGAGEQTRHLPLVLRRLAEHLERQQEVAQKIKVAAIYPSILICVSILVVGGLLTFVVPEVVLVFADMDADLPLITRALIAVSDFAAAWGVACFGMLLAIWIGLHRAMRHERFKRAVHRLALRVPLVGALVIDNDSARFARTLSVLLESGVNMVPALNICSRSAANLCLAEILKDAAARVREGENLSAPLREAKLFPPLLVHLIANGENSGELSTMLDTAANAHERSLRTKIAVMLGFIEPALILGMGVIVFAIVLGILLPIFDMNQLV